jgi:hypothetical protein
MVKTQKAMKIKLSNIETAILPGDPDCYRYKVFRNNKDITDQVTSIVIIREGILNKKINLIDRIKNIFR